MDLQLKELIETIKIEGVREAEGKSAAIIEEAQDRAKTIVEAARGEAEKILADARAEAAKLESSGREALKQASRDLLLKLEAQVIRFFDALVQKETEASFSRKVLEEGIITILKNWKQEGASEVLLPKRDHAQLKAALTDRLADELKGGVEIKPFAGIDAGFRISEKDGSAYYNFTAQGLAEMLSELLNPHLGDIMKAALED